MKYSSKSKSKKETPKAEPKATAKPTVESKSDAPGFFDKYGNILAYVLTGLSFLMALILFNPDVSVGGDDSTYLEAANKFANGTAFPTWQGPVYPMMLGYLIKIFGFSIVFFKLLSVIFFSASVYITYRIFARFANGITAFISAAVSAVSYMLLIHASSTYTEPFFMMLQAGFLWYLLELMQRESGWQTLDDKENWRKNLIHFSALALIVYVMFQTRSLAIVLIPAVLVYLLAKRKFRPAIVFGGASVLYHIVNTIYRRIFWDVESVSFTKQLDSILLINPYNPNEGYETFGGFVQRFWDNSVLYLSKHVMKLVGFYDYDSRMISAPITIMILIIVLAVGIYLWRNNRNLFTILGYIALMAGVTFVMLQKMWDQERLVMIYFPLLLGLVVYSLSGITRRWPAFTLFVGLLMLMANVIRTFGAAEFNLSDNFRTGTYNTYTDDWRNYMLASKWASDSLPEGSVVICRKSQMSWIASDGAENVKFQGIYNVYSFDADSMRYFLKDSLKATHVIMANLRLNPYELNGKTITTVRYTLSALMKKYASSVKMIKQFGTREPAYIFQLSDAEGPADESSLRCAVLVNPGNAVHWRDLILYYVRRKDFDRGAKTLAEARAANISNPEIQPELYSLEGGLNFEQQKFDKALECFTKVTEMSPDNYEAWFNRAVCLYNLLRFPEALEILAQARAHGLGPESADPFENAIHESIRYFNSRKR